MTDKKIYYFTFDRNCWNPRNSVGMHPYWVELHGADTKAEARDVMIRLYACGFRTHEEKDLEWIKETCKSGCYEQIHLPLPEDVYIGHDDPFFSVTKKSKKPSGKERRTKKAKAKSTISGHAHAYGSGGYVHVTSINSVGKSIKPISVSKFEKIMKNKGLAMGQISIATGVSFAAIRYLRDGHKLRKKTMETIADYLGVDPKDLI